MNLPDRIVKIKKYLVCPKCKKSLAESSIALECHHCKKLYSIKEGKLYFTDLKPEDIITDSIDTFKNKIKRFGRIYYFITFI